MQLKTIISAGLLFITLAACAQKQKPKEKTMATTENKILETATFGSGCFWCTEAIFLNVDGVEKVVSGYTGGKVKNPTYKEVCSGLTGHAEVIQLSYDPSKVKYEELLEIFWKTHDPTTLNRQGADEGTQYRSVIYYHNDEQKKLAEYYKKKLEDAKAFNDPIVTEISPATTFYKAEDYHQNYYNLNNNVPYCSYVIQPKLEKFKKVFKEKLKQ
jgi:peptide-methionine (S)-S-oxide reductase